MVVNKGQVVSICVADNGSGVPTSLRRRIFEPFFSTKEAKGPGLGLWVCKNLVEKYGGSIRLRSSGQGTVFRVCLPMKSD